MRKTSILAFSILAASAFVSAAGADDPADSSRLLDKPSSIAHVPLPRDPDNPQAKAEVRCTTFVHFMVKEIDTGQEGADQLSIVPVSANAKPACRKQNVASEKVVPPDAWSGYLGGAAGEYILFDADDGWNGGLGFAVFTPDARKLFEDVAKRWTSVRASADGLVLRYRRVYGAPCSLEADRAGCWAKVEHATGLSGAPPDCHAAYVAEEKRTPQFAKQDVDDPTAITYDAETTIGSHGARTVPIGRALSCDPEE